MMPTHFDPREQINKELVSAFFIRKIPRPVLILNTVGTGCRLPLPNELWLRQVLNLDCLTYPWIVYPLGQHVTSAPVRA